MSRFEKGEHYHVYNRGVEKRDIFLDHDDYNRFLFILDVFNDENSSVNTTRRVNLSEGSRTSLRPIGKKRLVDVVEYCLMPSHFHLLIRQSSDAGISRLMQKIGVGYTHYFNKKYKRSGVLFQGKTKSRHIDSNPYFMWIKRYIHLNPIEIVFPSTSKVGVKNVSAVINKLNEYRWVSCKDYGLYREDLKGNLREIIDNPR